ncbi:MAG TPA: diguanylate cyclase [Rectinemataceae bacterium]|nr:diguanylate cyclase [Rectinemataceae bacterium]
MGTMIPASSIYLPMAALCASIFVMNGLMAIWRRESGFVAYSLAFLFAALSSALGALSGFARIDEQAASRLLLLAFNLFMTWGIRIMQRRRRPWPPRFILYALAFALPIALGGWIFKASLWIELPSAIVSILLCGEYIFAIATSEIVLTMRVRASISLVPLMFILGNLSRLLPLITQGTMEPAQASVSALIANTVLAIIFYMGWEGAILVLDGARMQNELAVKNRELETLATTDKLTGLRNRLSLDHIFHTETIRAARYGESLSLIMLDIDHFKRVNDTYGHAIGDKVLVHVANIVRLQLREPDFAFRWGGEEFLIIAPHTDLAGATVVAEKLRAAVEASRVEAVGQVTISCGVAFGSASEPIESWFRRVDQALYRAKNEGRNRVCSWTPAMAAASAAAIHIEWRQSWESGNAIVDRGHRELVDIANSLLELSIGDGPTARIGEVLSRFMKMTARHFEEEEAVMVECDYPELGAHRALHARLLEKAEELSRQFASGKLGITGYFDFLVKDLLVDHIIGDDAKAFPWISPSEHVGQIGDSRR